jgi:hypothetical protein
MRTTLAAAILAFATTTSVYPACATPLTSFVYMYTGGPLSGDPSLGTNVMGEFKYDGDPTKLNGTYYINRYAIFSDTRLYTNAPGISAGAYQPLGLPIVTFKNGVITFWSLLMGSAFPPIGNFVSIDSSSLGDGVVQICSDPDGLGLCGARGPFEIASSGSAGTWTSPTPLPATLPLLAAGLSLFGWLARRRLAA